MEEMAPLESTEIEIPVLWGHVAGKTWGSKDNQPVLMLHGILDNAGSFDRLLQHLPRNFYYVSIDLPGHGKSSHFPPGLPLDYFNYVHTIGFVLEHLKWDTCICIGHSLGSQLATCYTILYPGRFKMLIAIDALLPYFMDDDCLVERVQELYVDAAKAMSDVEYRTYTKEEVIHALKNMRNSTLNTAAASALFSRSVTKVGDDMYKYNRDQRLKKGVRPWMNIEQALLLLNQNTTPIFAIFAKASYASFYEMHIKLTQHRKEITIQVVKGNHDVHNNNPEVVAPYICNYLSKNMFSSKL